MPILNNVNLDMITWETKVMQENPAKGLRVNRVEAQWQMDPLQPQLTMTLKYEGGETALECDSPTFMGGKGVRPGPMHYCISGLLACFLGTFVTVAASRGVELRSLKATGECQLDFTRAFGLSDNPAIRGVTFTLEVDSDAGDDALEEVRREALDRCPGVYAMANPIPVATQVRRP